MFLGLRLARFCQPRHPADAAQSPSGGSNATTDDLRQIFRRLPPTASGLAFSDGAFSPFLNSLFSSYTLRRRFRILSSLQFFFLLISSPLIRVFYFPPKASITIFNFLFPYVISLPLQVIFPHQHQTCPYEFTLTQYFISRRIRE